MLAERLLRVLSEHCGRLVLEVGLLAPLQRDTRPDLHERHEITSMCDNLLRLDEIGGIAVVVDSTDVVSCADTPPAQTGHNVEVDGIVPVHIDSIQGDDWCSGGGGGEGVNVSE